MAVYCEGSGARGGKKLRFFSVCLVLIGCVMAYLFMLPMWPVVYGLAFDAANTVAGGAHAYEYRATIGLLRWAPLLLFFVPAALSVVVIFQILYVKREGR